MFAAAVFDLFGTLLDVSSLAAAVGDAARDPAAFVATWRAKQLAYAFASSLMRRHEDFDAITLHALRFAARAHGAVIDAAGESRLCAAWRALQPFADAAPALRALAANGLRCAVLTNGTPATARAALAHAGLTALIGDVLSVEAAGAFKPDPRVYALLTQRYAVAPERIAFVSANGWDATGAAQAGLAVAWCNRAGAPAETFGPPPRWIVRGLDELPGCIARGNA